jgi:O-antigen/teichoic acid export membrane protein
MSSAPVPTRRSTRMIRASLISYSSFVCLFLSSVLVSRLLGVEGKGIFSLFMATITGLTVVGTLGLPQGQMYHASKNAQWLSHFMSNAVPFALLSGGVLALLYLGGGHALGFTQVTTLGWEGVIAGIFAVPVGVLLLYQRQYFLTLHRYELAKAAGATSATLPLIGYLVLYAGGFTSVHSFLNAFVVSQLLCLAIFQMVAHRVGPVQSRFSPEFARRSFSFGLWQYASDIAAYLMGRLDYFIVALYLGAAGLGIYSVAAGMAEIITRLSNEIGTMLYPVFASGNMKSGQPAAALRMVTFMALALGTVLAVLSGPMFRFLYGAAFADAVPVFRWLVFGAVVWSTTHVTWTYVSSTGRPGYGVLVFGLATGVDALLNVILLPRFGVLGAGLAAAASYFVAGVCFFHLFLKSEGCTVRAALVPRKADFQQLWLAFSEVQTGLLRALRPRPPSASER